MTWHRETSSGYMLTVAQRTLTELRGVDATILQEGIPVGRLHHHGLLELLPGFEWDGASGAIDTAQNLLESAFHDAAYIVIASGLLPLSAQKEADRMLLRGMLPARPTGILSALLYVPRWIRARYHFRAVRLFGHLHLEENDDGTTAKIDCK